MRPIIPGVWRYWAWSAGRECYTHAMFGGTMKATLLILTLAAVMPLLATPANGVSTPEPGTFVLLSLGLAGVGVAAWKRSRKK